MKNNIYRLFWTFFLGGVLGVIIETIWCFFDFGELSSRTSNLFFPFSIVWGMGAVLIITILHTAKEESILRLFIRGCILAGIFEFICGYVGERILGVTFWDYTGLPLHIGTYVNVFICLLWGLLCVLWKKWVDPVWEKKISSFIQRKKNRRLTVCMIIFMVVTNCVSGMALLRMEARNQGNQPSCGMEVFLDTYFPDQTLQQFFPKMKYISGEKVYPLEK